MIHPTDAESTSHILPTPSLLCTLYVQVRLEFSDLPRLASILRALAADAPALAAKRAALARTWTRLLWRESLPPDLAAPLRAAPDAFDSLMESLWLRSRYGLRGTGRPHA